MTAVAAPLPPPVDLTPVRAALVSAFGLRLVDARPGWRRYHRNDLTLVHEKDRWGTQRVQLGGGKGLTLDADTQSMLPDPRRFAIEVRPDPGTGVVRVFLAGGSSDRLARAVGVPVAALERTG